MRSLRSFLKTFKTLIGSFLVGGSRNGKTNDQKISRAVEFYLECIDMKRRTRCYVRFRAIRLLAVERWYSLEATVS